MLKTILDALTDKTAVGLILAASSATILFLMKQIPVSLGEMLWKHFTVRLEIRSDDDAFGWFNDWIMRHPKISRLRDLRVTSKTSETDEWGISLGEGRHFIWGKSIFPIIIERDVEEKQNGAYVLREKIILTTIGRSQAKVRKMIDQVYMTKCSPHTTDVKVWHQNQWELVGRKTKKSFDSIFLPKQQKQEIMQDCSWFLENQEWHKNCGVPYRRGYLFYGQPGTGKTSVVSALASTYGLPIYILNLQAVANDNELFGAFLYAGKNAIFLLEDIDAVCASLNREKNNLSQQGISLSGLLNAIDGAASIDCRILIMTTNHIDKLDPALIRAGRIDRKWKFDFLDKPLIMEMAKHFYADHKEWLAEVEKIADLQYTAAQWQTIFKASRGDASRLKEISSLENAQ